MMSQFGSNENSQFCYQPGDDAVDRRVKAQNPRKNNLLKRLYFCRHNRSSDVFNKLLQNKSLDMVEESPCKKRPLCRECEFPAVETPPKNCKPGAFVTLQTWLRSVIQGREVTADRAFQVKCYHGPFAFQLKETTRHHKAPDSATFRSKRS